MPTSARTHCARVCSRFPALEGIVGRNGAAKHRGRRKSGQELLCHKFNATHGDRNRSTRERDCKKESYRAHVDITKRVDMPRCAKDRGNSGARRWRPDKSLEFQHISHSTVKIASRASGVFDGRASIWRGTDFKCQSVLRYSMGDDADMPPRLKDVSHGGAELRSRVIRQ